MLASLESVAAAARAYGAAARSERTRHEYSRQWRTFETWCGARSFVALPCAPATLALYLTERADRGIRPSSLNVAIAAVAWHHTAAGIPHAEQPHRNPQVAEVWRGIRRTKGTAPRRVAPVAIDELRAMVATLPSTLAGTRDRALLLVGFAGALRRSELAALNVDDLAFTRKGVVVTIRRSKTDQEGAGATIGLPRGKDAATCPVRTLQAWLAAAGVEAGPVFRSLRCGRLGGAIGGRDVARIVQRTAAAAGFDPREYAGHSLRAGLATTAARAGKADRAIMNQGRWAGRAMVDRYVRDARLLEDENAAADIGL